MTLRPRQNSAPYVVSVLLALLAIGCSRDGWVHTPAKASLLLPNGTPDMAKWNSVCDALSKADSCDVCAEFGWYDDQECDVFCPSGDSKCPDQTLVGHWTLDEEAGRTANDASPFGHHGMYAGEPTPASGRFGGALEFHGPRALQTSNDRILIDDSANLNLGASSFSYGLWVKVDMPVGEWDIPFSKGGSNARAPGFDMELGIGKWLACLFDGDELTCGTFTHAPVLGRWVHLMVVVDREAKKLQLYVDGGPVLPVEIATSFGSVSTSRPACIGAGTVGTNPFRGLIDDVRVYNRALGPAEVFQLQK